MEVLTLQEKGSKQHTAKHGDHHSKFGRVKIFSHFSLQALA